MKAPSQYVDTTKPRPDGCMCMIPCVCAASLKQAHKDLPMPETNNSLPPIPEIDWSAKTVELSSEQLEAFFDCGGTWPLSEHGVRVISEEITGKRRWSYDEEIVFTFDGAPEGFALCGYYNHAATEMQEDEGWDSTFVIVRAVPVVRIEYHRPELALKLAEVQSQSFMQGGSLADMAKAAKAAEG